MEEKKKFKGYPFLVGLDHDYPSPELLSKLYKFIDEHAKERRTLFIEKHSFFSKIADYAKSKGLKIVVLDRKTFSKVKVDWKNPLALLTGIQFIPYDLRERAWNNTLRLQAKGEDIVLAHPAHIDGLIKNYSFPKEKIIFKQDYPRTTPRMSPASRILFKASRIAERKKRQKKIKRKIRTRKIIHFLPNLIKKSKRKRLK